MDEKPDQIIEHIETQRNQLGANLNELENRVRQTADWRTHYDRNPMLMLSAALGGGILLGAIVSGSRPKSGSSLSKSRSSGSGSSTYGAYSGSSGSQAVSLQKQRASETIDNIKAALIGFATAKAKEFLNQALPGFDHHLRDVESRKSQQPAYDAYGSSSQPGTASHPSEFGSAGTGPGGVTTNYGSTGGSYSPPYSTPGGADRSGLESSASRTNPTNPNPS